MSFICNITIYCLFVSDEEKKLEMWKNQDSLMPLDGRLFVVTMAFISLLLLYSTSFYPHLPSYFGGGDYQNQLRIYNKNEIVKTGKIVYYNQDSIFLKKNNSTISKSSISDIESIEYINNNNNPSTLHKFLSVLKKKLNFKAESSIEEKN